MGTPLIFLTFSSSFQSPIAFLICMCVRVCVFTHAHLCMCLLLKHWGHCTYISYLLKLFLIYLTLNLKHILLFNFPSFSVIVLLFLCDSQYCCEVYKSCPHLQINRLTYRKAFNKFIFTYLL